MITVLPDLMLYRLLNSEDSSKVNWEGVKCGLLPDTSKHLQYEDDDDTSGGCC